MMKPGITRAVFAMDGYCVWDSSLVTDAEGRHHLFFSRWPIDARGFVDALKSGGADIGRDHLVLSQLAQTCQRSVRFRDAGRDYICIRTFRSGYYALPECLSKTRQESRHV